MTNEQRQQLLQDIVTGKQKPQNEVQGYLVGVISRTGSEVDQVNQAITQASKQLRSLEDRGHELVGVHNQAINDLRELLVDPAPAPQPAAKPDPAVAAPAPAPIAQPEAGLNADEPGHGELLGPATDSAEGPR